MTTYIKCTTLYFKYCFFTNEFLLQNHSLTSQTESSKEYLFNIFIASEIYMDVKAGKQETVFIRSMNIRRSSKEHDMTSTVSTVLTCSAQTSDAVKTQNVVATNNGKLRQRHLLLFYSRNFHRVWESRILPNTCDTLKVCVRIFPHIQLSVSYVKLDI